jgi:thiol:disulfide interchange protein DsbD
MKLFRFILIPLLFLGMQCAFSQTALTPVKWEFSYQETDETSGELVLKAKIEPNWHIYSQTQSGDGPLPTVFKFTKTPDYDLKGAVDEPDPQRTHSDVFDADVAMFSNETIFSQKIKRNTKKAFEIMGEVECMSCNESMCLPPKTLKFVIKVPQSELR